MTARFYGKTVFLGKNAVSLSAHYYPMWQRGGLCFHENGGRTHGECLDMTITLWKFNLNVTIWGLRRLSWITKHIPRPDRSGYTIGWIPLGAVD